MTEKLFGDNPEDQGDKWRRAYEAMTKERDHWVKEHDGAFRQVIYTEEQLEVMTQERDDFDLHNQQCKNLLQEMRERLIKSFAENAKLREVLVACAPSWLPEGVRNQRREALTQPKADSVKSEPLFEDKYISPADADFLRKANLPESPDSSKSKTDNEAKHACVCSAVMGNTGHLPDCVEDSPETTISMGKPIVITRAEFEEIFGDPECLGLGTYECPECGPKRCHECGATWTVPVQSCPGTHTRKDDGAKS